MKPISTHASESAYDAFRMLAARSGRPVAELIRQAMEEYLQAGRSARPSLLEMKPHRSGRLRRRWTRAEILDEMVGRGPRR